MALTIQFSIWNLLPIEALVQNSVVHLWKSQIQILKSFNIQSFFSSDPQSKHGLLFHLNLIESFFLCRHGRFCVAVSESIRILEQNSKAIIFNLFEDVFDCYFNNSGSSFSISNHITLDFKDRLYSAHDFSSKVKLLYNVPEPLNLIIDSSTLQQYHTIFQSLVAALQVDSLVNRIFLSTKWKSLDRNNMVSCTILKLGSIARKFSSSYFSYLHHYAVQIPWASFKTKVDEISKNQITNQTSSVEDLIGAQDQCLREIFDNLFLSWTSKEVRSLIDELMNLVLQLQRYMLDYPILEDIQQLYLKTKCVFNELLRNLDLLAVKDLGATPASVFRGILA